jgi:hypothetical protein
MDDFCVSTDVLKCQHFAIPWMDMDSPLTASIGRSFGQPMDIQKTDIWIIWDVQPDDPWIFMGSLCATWEVLPKDYGKPDNIPGFPKMFNAKVYLHKRKSTRPLCISFIFFSFQ